MLLYCSCLCTSVVYHRSTEADSFTKPSALISTGHPPLDMLSISAFTVHSSQVLPSGSSAVMVTLSFTSSSSGWLVSACIRYLFSIRTSFLISLAHITESFRFQVILQETRYVRVMEACHIIIEISAPDCYLSAVRSYCV